MRPEYAPVPKAQASGDSSDPQLLTRRHVLCAVGSLAVGGAVFAAMVYFAHTGAFVSMVDWVQVSLLPNGCFAV